MSTTNDTRPTKTVTPHLVCADASAAIAFYQRAFNAEERFRLPGPDGKGIMHACIQIGDSPVFLVDENPQWGSHSPTSLKGTPVTIHLQVENVDELYAQAVAALSHQPERQSRHPRRRRQAEGRLANRLQRNHRRDSRDCWRHLVRAHRDEAVCVWEGAVTVPTHPFTMHSRPPRPLPVGNANHSKCGPIPARSHSGSPMAESSRLSGSS
jgi:uncharacterized glyoxalase superfamily protein PhnB